MREIDILLAEPSALRALFHNADPFPHLVIDDFLPQELARRAAQGVPAPGTAPWIAYKHFNERKLGLSRIDAMPEALQEVVAILNGDAFVGELSRLVELPLVSDETMAGGGIHQTESGGFLNLHVDFQAHPHRPQWRRRVNVLLYLNEDWEEEWGGHLELWRDEPLEPVKQIAPHFNRCVIFLTGPGALHGHPDPLRTPPGITRKSLALYYFTIEEQAFSDTPTRYQARPGDSVRKKIAVKIGQAALYAYIPLRRWFGVDHATLGKWLERLFP